MAGRQVGDLVLMPEGVWDASRRAMPPAPCKADPLGGITWHVGVCTRTGGKTKADGGSYRRVRTKRVRKMEPGMSIWRMINEGGSIDSTRLSWHVNHERLAEGWEEAVPAIVYTDGDYIQTAHKLIAVVQPFTTEGWPAAD